MSSFGIFTLPEPDLSNISFSGIPKTNPEATPSNPIPAEENEQVIQFGKFKDLSYQELVDRHYDVLFKHIRPIPEPNACQEERCGLPWKFINWFKIAYKKDLMCCTDLPYYVRCRKTRLPDTDPKYPGKIFQDVWDKDPEYLSTIPNAPEYINIINIHHHKKSREDSFPKTIRSKHAGRTFDEVGRLAPDYFQWIVSSFTGKEKAYHDASDWWLENEMKYLKEAEIKQEEQINEASELTGNEVFTSGKYKDRTYLDVYDINPGYFVFLDTKAKTREKSMLNAIAWYRQTRK